MDGNVDYSLRVADHLPPQERRFDERVLSPDVKNRRDEVRKGVQGVESAIEADKKPLIAIMYAPEDERFARELEKHLRTLVRSKKVDLWYPGMIGAGMDYRNEEEKKLSSAKYVIVLASADFNASDYLADKVGAIAPEKLLIIPIRPCDMSLFDDNGMKLLEDPVSASTDTDGAYLRAIKNLKGLLFPGNDSSSPDKIPQNTQPAAPATIKSTQTNVEETVLTESVEDKRLQRYHDQYRRWPEHMQRRRSWSDIKDCLLKPYDHYLQLVEGLEKGILFGLDEYNNALFADEGDELMFTNLTYQETYQAVHFKHRRGEDIKTGYEMFPYDKPRIKSPEIIMFEKFTQKPFVGKGNYSWLDCGANPNIFMMAGCLPQVTKLEIIEHVEKPMIKNEVYYSIGIPISRDVTVKRDPKDYLKGSNIGVRRLLRVPPMGRFDKSN